MASQTSGAINTVVVTADQIIKDALQDLRALPDMQEPSAGDLVDGRRKMNFILKRLATKGLLLWCMDQVIIPCQAGKASYTIGPFGADVLSYRPLRIPDTGTFIRFTSGGQNFDTSLTLLSRNDYNVMGNKGSQGIANSFYYDPQMTQTPNVAYDPSKSAGILNLYVTPIDTSRTVYLQTQRPLQDIVNSTDALDVPIEWYETISKMVSAAMSDKYNVPEPRLVRIKNEAKAMEEDLADWGATEQAPTQFTPSQYTEGMVW